MTEQLTTHTHTHTVPRVVHTHTHTHTHTLVGGLIVYRYFRKVTGTEGLMMKAIVFPGGKHKVSSKFEALGVWR